MVSLSKVKSYLQITNNTYDSLINTLIDYVFNSIESYTGRTLKLQVYTDEVLRFLYSRNETGGQTEALDFHEAYGRLFVNNRPIIDVISFKEQGNDVNPVDYYIDKNLGIIYPYRLLNDANNGLLISYTAGYTTETIPKDLEYVTCEGVRYIFESLTPADQGSRGVDVVSKKVGDFSVTFAENPYGINLGRFLSSFDLILKKYKSVTI